jgi:hypothetical protein
VRAHRHEDRIEAALGLFRHQVLDPVVRDHPHAEPLDPFELVTEDVAGEAVRGDAVAHHPARLRSRVAYLDLVTEPCQVIRRGQAARPSTDHQHPLAAGLRRRVERPALLAGQVAEEAFHRVDRHRGVEPLAIADVLAGVIADSAVNRGQRIVRDQLPPRPLVLTRLDVGEVRLDVLPGRAAGVARRQQVHVHRPPVPHRPGARMPVQQIRQPCHITQRAAHVNLRTGSRGRRRSK